MNRGYEDVQKTQERRQQESEEEKLCRFHDKHPGKRGVNPQTGERHPDFDKFGKYHGDNQEIRDRIARKGGDYDARAER